ncbi:O-antigen polymerase [Vibrio cyclitrophicus]
MYTIVPFLTFLILFGLIIKKGFLYAIIHPITYISLLHNFYFSFYSSSNPYLLEIQVMTALGVFTYFSLFLMMAFGKSDRLFPALVGWSKKMEKDNIDNRFPKAIFVLYFLLLFVFSTALNSYIYGGVLPSISRFYTLLPVNEVPTMLTTMDKTFIKLAFVVSFVLFLGREYGRVGIFTIFVCLLLYLLTVFPIGSRGNLLSIVMALFFAKVVHVLKTGSRFKLDVISSVFVFVIISLSIVQYNVRSYNFNSDSSSIGEVFDAIVLNYSGENVEKRDITIMEEHLTKVVIRYGKEKDFLLGHTFYSIFSNIIPRSFWNEKPVGVGRILAYDDGAPPETNISFAVSYFGEGWVNSSWWGVVYFSAFFGALTGIFSRLGMYYFQSNDVAYVLLGFVYIYSASMFVRGDMLSAWGQVIYPLVLVNIIIYMYKKLF